MITQAQKRKQFQKSKLNHNFEVDGDRVSFPNRHLRVKDEVTGYMVSTFPRIWTTYAVSDATYRTKLARWEVNLALVRRLSNHFP